MIVTGEHLERVGRACFGEQWQHDMARALEVGDRKIRYWMADHPEHPMPDDMPQRLIAVASQVHDGIYAAIRELFPER